MTVEQLIEMLERQYPQVLVKIEVTGSTWVISYKPLDACALLEPWTIETDNRTGVAIIYCDRSDC